MGVSKRLYMGVSTHTYDDVLTHLHTCVLQRRPLIVAERQHIAHGKPGPAGPAPGGGGGWMDVCTDSPAFPDKILYQFFF